MPCWRSLSGATIRGPTTVAILMERRPAATAVCRSSSFVFWLDFGMPNQNVGQVGGEQSRHVLDTGLRPGLGD